ncbi:MAG TPA: winged helix-turn-helix domain-containing protein [Pyrinomonadaceae bacterium]|nr:winged helix-turn-helix domain-containing protein [Pyrinomonadaceae bacterium]
MERVFGNCYEFGDFRFNPTERYLLYKGETISLTPKALDTLFALVSRSGHLVTKEELLKEVWKDAFVEEATIVQNISTLRKALGRDGKEDKFIETVSKKGYRFVAAVKTCNGAGTQPASWLQPETALSGNSDQTAASDAGPNRIVFSEANSDSRLLETTEVIELLGRPARIWKQVAIGASVLFAVLVLAVGVLVLSSRRNRSVPNEATSFEKMSLVKTTQTGKVRTSAISPDGKYVAYVTFDGGTQSLWIRQVSAPNDAQIVSAAEVRYLGLTFSPDGSYVFFVTYESGKNEGVLYRIPAIGGSPQVVIRDIDSPITFSPDAKQLAFVRGYPVQRESSVVTANVDGTNEQRIATRVFPAFFSSDGPAWSPDGTVIACGVRSPDPKRITETVIGIEPYSHHEALLTNQRWAETGRVSWDKGGSKIILTASQELGAHQLWQISWPDGLAHRITNDLNNYEGVSLAPNLNVLSTVETEANSRIWVLTNGKEAQALEDTKNDGLRGITWTPDDKMVFTSVVAGQDDIWSINADGSGKRAITNDVQTDFAPTISGDGRYIIYSASADGKPAHIWRMNIDGSGLRQLTFGNDDRHPSTSADGKWVFYSSFNHNEENDSYYEVLWKVPIDGGEATMIVNQTSAAPVVSPDGKLIAFRNQMAPHLPWTVRVISYETGEVIKDLSIGSAGGLQVQWAPDGRSLTYVITRNGTSNIWSVPLNGGAPKQLTHFDSSQIFRYAWSHDGKRLALVRGVQNGDVVLIRDFG